MNIKQKMGGFLIDEKFVSTEQFISNYAIAVDALVCIKDLHPAGDLSGALFLASEAIEMINEER